MLHDWNTNGLIPAENKFINRYDKKKRCPSEPGTLFKNVVKGKINFLKMVKGDQDPTYQKFCEKLASLDSAFSFVKIIRDGNQDIFQEAVFVIEKEDKLMQGTAFMLYPYGIVTSAHFLEQDKLDAVLYKVNDPNNKRKAIVKYIDFESDIAVLENFQNWAKHGFVRGDSNSLEIQDDIKLIGFPGHAEGKSIQIRIGKVTHRSRWGKGNIKIINISEPILFGNSGGPVLNDRNEVIGVAFWGAENLTDVQHVECAVIPIENILRFYQQ
jgi:S1-C subfamily serine protease